MQLLGCLSMSLDSQEGGHYRCTWPLKVQWKSVFSRFYCYYQAFLFPVLLPPTPTRQTQTCIPSLSLHQTHTHSQTFKNICPLSSPVIRCPARIWGPGKGMLNVTSFLKSHSLPWFLYTLKGLPSSFIKWCCNLSVDIHNPKLDQKRLS